MLRNTYVRLKHIGMPKSMYAPISNGYSAELDETAELEAENAAYYSFLIGVL